MNKKPDPTSVDPRRRDFLRQGLATGLGLAVAGTVGPAAAAQLYRGPRELSFYHVHTGEKLTVEYWSNGRYLTDSMEEINFLLRDHRSGTIEQMDTGLLDMLYYLKLRTGPGLRYEVISGYRSASTNHMLRTRDRGGVARKSLHMLGQAIDVRLPGVPLNTLRRVAMQMQNGGVGYYPKSNFLHLDVGRVRNWANLA